MSCITERHTDKMTEAEIKRSTAAEAKRKRIEVEAANELLRLEQMERIGSEYQVEEGRRKTEKSAKKKKKEEEAIFAAIVESKAKGKVRCFAYVVHRL